MAPSDRHHSPVSLASTLVIAGLISSLFASNHPALAQTADPDFWQTNGRVNALAVGGNTLYLGGTFDFVGPYTGGGVPLDPTSGAAIVPFAKIHGVVFALADDGAGGFYIGGIFDQVAGLPRANLARVNADGTVDPWNPGSDGAVRAIAVSGSLVYVGGDFAQVGGQARARIAAVNATTGAVAGWNPSANASVYSLYVLGSTVYAAGEFTDIGGQLRTYLAGIRTTNGNPTTWAPNPNGSVYALDGDGTTLWIGGQFASASGSARAGLASYELATGALTSWQPVADGTVYALHRSGSTMYVGGSITTLGGQARGRLGAVDATSGALLPFDGAANQTVHAILVQGSTVYAAGKFSSLGGQPRAFLGALDQATGIATSWAPSCEATAWALRSQGSNVYAGGSYRLLGGVKRKGLAAFDLTTKAATSWNPATEGWIETLLADGGVLYVGGYFGHIAGGSRTAAAAFDIGSGALNAWNPSVEGFTDPISKSFAPPFVYALEASGSSIYVGGIFGRIGGQFRSLIGEVDRTTGAPTAWNPGAGISLNTTLSCRAIDADSGPVYVGGTFPSMGGAPRRNFAGIDVGTGAATSEDPSPDSRVYAFERSGTALYAGGQFAQFDGDSRSGLAALDLASGLLLPWNPAATGSFGNGIVFALALDGSTIYVGGMFEALGGESRLNLAAIDANTGAALPWNPGSDDLVKDIVVAGGRVFVGGGLNDGSGAVARGLAVFDALPVVGVADRGGALVPRVLASAPSPAVAGAFLRFTLPRASSVSLALYDAAGRHVRTILERRAFQAGEQRVPLEPGLAPGLYFLRLEADGAVANGKLVVATSRQ